MNYAEECSVFSLTSVWWEISSISHLIPVTSHLLDLRSQKVLKSPKKTQILSLTPVWWELGSVSHFIPIFPSYSFTFAGFKVPKSLKRKLKYSEMTHTRRLLKKVLKKELRKVQILKQIFGSGTYIPLYQCTTRWVFIFQIENRLSRVELATFFSWMYVFVVLPQSKGFMQYTDEYVHNSTVLYNLLQMCNTCGVACMATICHVPWQNAGHNFHSAHETIFNQPTKWKKCFVVSSETPNSSKLTGPHDDMQDMIYY